MHTNPIDPLKLPVWRLVNEGFVQGRAEVVGEICHPRYRNDTSVRAVPDGPAGLAAHIGNARGNISGIELNIVDILAQGDRSAVLWQTRGIAGKYVGLDAGGGDTSAWLIGHFGFVDGLLLDHLINWEPLRLMVQGGAAIGAGGADLASMDLRTLRCAAFTAFVDRERACAPRVAPADTTDADLAIAALRYSWGQTDVPAPVADQAYLSFADLVDQHGRDGLIARRAMARGVFADPRLEVESLVSDGSRVIIRFSLSVRHVGDWLGMPASGRHLTTTGSAYARIEDGAIAMWVELIDVLRLIRQIGGLAAVLPGCFPDQ